MMTKELVFNQIKDQLAAGQLEAAINEIKLLAPNQSIIRELKKYRFLLGRLRKLFRQGIMRKGEFHQARNKVHLALLEVLWEVERSPSSLGLLTAIVRIPIGWKAAIFSPMAMTLAAYFWLAFPYPFKSPSLEEPDGVVRELPIEVQQDSVCPDAEIIVLKRVGP
ncbi:MAG: hypothetical protein H6558_23030 [Lewinellaceae bacterium]|nr:hypothetical protein [Lewinellaceae bacterium]